MSSFSSFSDSQSTRIDNKPLPVTYYMHGPFDVFNVVFYAMVWIIIHALLQEYIWEVCRFIGTHDMAQGEHN